MKTLVKIKRDSDTALLLTWADNEVSRLTLKKMRDECPCANCKGETVLFASAPPKLPVFTPGMYELKRAEIVGNYSLQPFWGDGHQTGLYTFDYLYALSQTHPA